MMQLPELIPAVRAAVAALAALAVAHLLRLENPYWAAMTALIVVQPTRALLFEKSYYRLIGTAIGSAAAWLLLLQTASPLVLTAALSIWIAACVGVGNLLHGLRSYAALMAACTCAVIAMSGYQNPGHADDLAFGRVACIIIGILVTTCVTALFTPRHSMDDLDRRLTHVTADAVRWLGLLGCARSQVAAELEQEILREAAEIEALLDAGGMSASFKNHRRNARSLLGALLSLLALGRLDAEPPVRQERGSAATKLREAWGRQLQELAAGLERAPISEWCRKAKAVAAETALHLPQVGRALYDLAGANEVVLDHGMYDGAKEPAYHLIRHRDRQEAGRAAVRGGLVIAVVGLVWSLTGWSKGPLMLMALSIMISIFSNKEHPAMFVGNIFIGAATGSALAVFCRVVLLDGVSGFTETVAVIAPFILLGAYAMQHRRTVIPATDATLFFIFVIQPGVPVTIAAADLAIGAVAMVSGVAAAYIGYTLLVPVNPAIRMRSLLAAIAKDVARVSANEQGVAPARIRAKLQHRVLRLLALAKSCDTNRAAVVSGAIALLALTASIERLRQKLQHDEFHPEDARQTREKLARISGAARKPPVESCLLHPWAYALSANIAPLPPNQAEAEQEPAAMGSEIVLAI
ncbi:membrane protein [Geoanaerobacter pelophilus]|uniref:Membrane protein n=1 Tax=Geoanaerobacter pelophilus TaxID=60036 RepID=A0ABQ0MGC6_9BACT|nr:FUSC family protein [Geoanaerobacter pelophilus]GAW66154.1 membrane protein [Geoanaerobacter pelophilus]